MCIFCAQCTQKLPLRSQNEIDDIVSECVLCTRVLFTYSYFHIYIHVFHGKLTGLCVDVIYAFTLLLCQSAI